ncbi:MAG: hypothetical protein R3C58_06505 [Parvularculaceae bacterium]
MSEALKRSAGPLYAAYYGAQFVLIGVQLPFFAGWLALKGFAPSEIGLVTGASLIARLLFGAPVAFWADHQADERRSLRIVTFFFALGAAGLLIAPNKLLIGASAALMMWTFGLLVPLTDTAVLRADRNGWLHYGQTRAAGSGFFLATNILGGALLTRLGVAVAAPVMAASAAVAFAMTFVCPPVRARGGAKPVSWRERRNSSRIPYFSPCFFQPA